MTGDCRGLKISDSELDSEAVQLLKNIDQNTNFCSLTQRGRVEFFNYFGILIFEIVNKVYFRLAFFLPIAFSYIGQHLLWLTWNIS